MKYILLLTFLILYNPLFGQTNLNNLSNEICDCFKNLNNEPKDKADELITKCLNKKRKKLGNELDQQLNKPENQIEFIKLLGGNCEEFIAYITKTIYQDQSQNLTDKDYTENIYKILAYFNSPSEPGKLPKSISIDPGEVGLLYNIYLNKIYTDSILHAGFHIIQPHDSVITFDIRQKMLEETFDIRTRDGSIISMQLNLKYNPNPKAVGLIYQIYGVNYEDIYIIPELRFFSRSILANHTSTELYRQDKTEITKAIIDSLATDFEETNYFNYHNLEIIKIEYPHIIEQAKKEGLLEYYELLKSNKKSERIEGIAQLLSNGSKTAYLIILTHWSTEKDQEVLDFIIEQLAKD